MNASWVRLRGELRLALQVAGISVLAAAAAAGALVLLRAVFASVPIN